MLWQQLPLCAPTWQLYAALLAWLFGRPLRRCAATHRLFPPLGASVDAGSSVTATDLAEALGLTPASGVGVGVAAPQLVAVLAEVLLAHARHSQLWGLQSCDARDGDEQGAADRSDAASTADETAEGEVEVAMAEEAAGFQTPQKREQPEALFKYREEHSAPQEPPSPAQQPQRLRSREVLPRPLQPPPALAQQQHTLAVVLGCIAEHALPRCPPLAQLLLSGSPPSAAAEAPSPTAPRAPLCAMAQMAVVLHDRASDGASARHVVHCVAPLLVLIVHGASGYACLFVAPS